jgi:hypothetical protein
MRHGLRVIALLLLCSSSWAGTRPPAVPRQVQKADPELARAVRGICALGGRGCWFSSVSPFSADGKRQHFFLLQAPPTKTCTTAGLYLARLDHANRLLGDYVRAGTPVVVGTIPLQAGVEAAALGCEFKLASDALAAGPVTQHQNVVLLQPGADKYVLAHEHRHWLDFEDTSFGKSFDKDMKPYYKARYLTTEQKQLPLRLTWEIRGYATQAELVRRDAEQGLAYFDRGGTVHGGGKKQRADYYGFQRGEAINGFVNNYGSALYGIADKIKTHSAKDYARFVELLSKYDLSSEGNRELTFRKVVGPR